MDADIDAMRRLMAEQLQLSGRLRARVRELEDARRAPLAVVGMAVRLPGGLDTPADYWDFLLGTDSVLTGVPADRPGLRAVHDPSRDRPGTSYVDKAGFRADVAGFDADFFGISQREAEALDPQQRLLLETAWEAMESAGIAVHRAERTSAGVFVGIMATEYGERLAGREDKSGIDPYYGTGSGHCFAAGRISYALGLAGPALSVDTACSSSLVALHLAARAVRSGECRYALVGGSNLIFSPDLMVSLCQSGALAADGRSKSFTAAADGYGRGEGAGVLVLMDLAAAEAEGRPVLAVLRGTAVNHDGAASGLTVPSGPAQQDVLRAALADAGVDPAELGWVEAHGTGTSLGDPIEVGALDAVVGSGAPGRREPVGIGSVKSRIGHLEAAAGIAALVKVVLMLRHAYIPAALDPADGPLNPLIPWDRTKVTVPAAAMPWPAGFARRLAGVSAFGLSGTNAHAVLEAYEPAPAAEVATGPARPELLTLSVRAGADLPGLADAVVRRLGRLAPADLPAFCHTARAGRVAFERRIAVTGATPAELAAKLTAAAAAPTAAPAGPAGPGPATLRVRPEPAALTAAVAELAAAFGDLAPAAADAEAGPEVRLQRVLQALGLRTTVRVDPAAPWVAAVEWGGRSCPLVDDDPAATTVLLLDLVAALFTAGYDLRLAALRGAGTTFSPDLPHYPFRHKRFWIDEPVARSAAGAVPLLPVPGPEAAGRLDAVYDFLLDELTAVLRAEEKLDCSRTFLDLGGDSFTAMLFARGIEQQYNVLLSTDDLSDDVPLSTLLGRLSEHVGNAGRPAAELLGQSA